MGGGRNWEPRSGGLKDVAQAMEEAVPEQEVGKINVTEETIMEVLKKKKTGLPLVQIRYATTG